MPVLARDAVASDHLVYAWPFPIGPEEQEVACAEDELVVMCPAWIVGDRLGPGRHRWRTPDPSRPVSAYFVLTAPVEVSFDMMTQFLIPTTGQAVRLRASGSLQVRCMDPALLVAQFVGLPFDQVNEGVLRSVSRSIERMLARLLTRRVVMAGTPQAVTDPSMLTNIIEELVAYNPTAGAVFGVELVRFGHLSIAADDGSRPWQHMTNGAGRVENSHVGPAPSRSDLLETQRSRPAHAPTLPPPIGGASAAAPPPIPTPGNRAGQPPTTNRASGQPPTEASGEIVPKRTVTQPPTEASGEIVPKRTVTQPPSEASGEINIRQAKKTSLGHPAVSATTPAGGVPAPAVVAPPPAAAGAASSPGLDPNRSLKSPVPAARQAVPVEVPESADEITDPGVDLSTPLPGAPDAPLAATPVASAVGTPPPPDGTPAQESRGSILGIGVAQIGSSGVASGEITKKIAPGGRVLVPGPNGLMQSATVRQLLQGYYELEVGGSGETIWVPVNGVVPE